MSSFFKALIVVVVGIILLGILATGVGYFWWSRHGEQYKEAAKEELIEGKSFGKDTDEEGCVSEALFRSKQDQGISGSIKSVLFLGACLDSCEETPGFCDGVPPEHEIMKSAGWQTDQCTKAGMNDSYCQQFFRLVQKYCDKKRKR